MVHGAQQREQHLPEALLPGAVAEAAALACHHREQRPHRAVAHLRPRVSAQSLQSCLLRCRFLMHSLSGGLLKLVMRNHLLIRSSCFCTTSQTVQHLCSTESGHTMKLLHLCTIREHEVVATAC